MPRRYTVSFPFATTLTILRLVDRRVFPTMTTEPRRFLPVIPLLFAFLLVSCGTPGAGEEIVDVQTPVVKTGGLDEGAEVGGWIFIWSLSDAESLNPVTSNDATASEINGYMYETLTTTDPVTLEPIPWIAEELPVISEDRLTYEFTLRKEARFSDGKPVTGEDFIFYLKTIKNPHILKVAPIRGYYARVDSASLIDGDPYRLRVVMNEPYYLGAQWAGGLYAYPKHIWDPENRSAAYSFAELNGGDSLKNPAVAAMAEHIEDEQKNFDPSYLIGSGPYIFDEHRRGDRSALRRNPDYWNIDHRFGKNWPEKIVWLTINDKNAALSALKAGEIDFFPQLDQVQFRYEKVRFEKNDLVPAQYDYPAYNYIAYNSDRPDKPYLADPKVRRAFAHAIDREKMIEKIFFGNAVNVNSPIYRNRPEYDTTITPYPYDLSEARRLLEEAGWKDSDGDGIRDKMVDGKKVQMEFALQLNSGNNNRRQMSIIFTEALRQIGVKVNPTTLEWSVFLERLDKHEFDATMGGWAMNPTEGDMYQLWHSESSVVGGSNYTSYNNPRVDELIEAIRGEFDYEKRKEMYREIQSIIHEEQPYNFLVSELRVCGYHNRFRNVGFFAPRPCFNAGWWWIPGDERKYGTSTAAQSVATR